jgi:hypothetical protein
MVHEPVDRHGAPNLMGDLTGRQMAADVSP